MKRVGVCLATLCVCGVVSWSATLPSAQAATKKSVAKKSSVKTASQKSSKASAYVVPPNLAEPFLLNDSNYRVLAYEETLVRESSWFLGLLVRGDKRLAIKAIGGMGDLGKDFPNVNDWRPGARKVTVQGVNAIIVTEGTRVLLRWFISGTAVEVVGVGMSEQETLSLASAIIPVGKDGEFRLTNLPSDVEVKVIGQYEDLVGSPYVLRWTNKSENQVVMMTVTRVAPAVTELSAIISNHSPAPMAGMTVYVDPVVGAATWQATPTVAIQLGVLGAPLSDELIKKVVAASPKNFDRAVDGPRRTFREQAK